MTLEKQTVKELLAQLTLPKLWGMAAAIIGLLVASFTLGALLQNASFERKLLVKESKIDELGKKLSTLELKVEELESDKITQATRINILYSKTRFQKGYLTYLRSHGNDNAKKIFVDLICEMWRKDKAQQLEMKQAPLGMSTQQLVYGTSKELRDFIMQQHVPGAQLHKLTLSEWYDFEMENLERNPLVLDQVESMLASTSLFKVVQFSKDESYTLPNEIGAAVHERDNCKSQNK